MQVEYENGSRNEFPNDGTRLGLMKKTRMLGLQRTEVDLHPTEEDVNTGLKVTTNQNGKISHQ